MPCLSAGLRLLRAGVFSGVCVVLSVGGHVLASGRMVPGWALALAVLAGVGLGWVGGARECSGRRLVVGMAVGQLALHWWFSWAAGQAARRAGSAHGHGHGDGHHVDAGSQVGLGMLLAHVGVAAAAAAWLRVGEAAVFRLLARLDARVRASVRVVLGRVGSVAGWGPVRVPVRHGLRVFARELLTRHDVVRRGPPVGGFAR